MFFTVILSPPFGNSRCRFFACLQDECKSKYGLPVYYRFLRCFELMPLCAVVANDHGRYFCTHGGISPGLESLDQIAALDRRWVDYTGGIKALHTTFGLKNQISCRYSTACYRCIVRRTNLYRILYLLGSCLSWISTAMWGGNGMAVVIYLSLNPPLSLSCSILRSCIPFFPSDAVVCTGWGGVGYRASGRSRRWRACCATCFGLIPPMTRA